MQILPATLADIPAIQTLATHTWHMTYDSLVPAGQVDYMLGLFYTDEVLHQQLTDPKHHFFVCYQENQLVGYAQGIEQANNMKLSKLYVLPNQQGNGIGQHLMKAIEHCAQSLHYSIIQLYVNRGNPAQQFYEKQGFVIVREEDVPIGDYYMNDFVMEKSLWV